MSKILGFASTAYQILVFLFLKDAYLSNDEVDLVVTDKTPLLEELYKNGRLQPYFNKVIFADGRKIKNPYKNAAVVFYESFIHNKTTDAMMDAPLETYDEMYFASPGLPDEIVKEIAKTLIKKNKKIRFHRYEDGFASYTKKTAHVINTDLGQKMYRLLWKYDVTQTENDLYLFAPEMADSNIDFQIKKIESTKERVEKITKIAKDIFRFEAVIPKEDYIFLGQGAENAMNNANTYQKLVKRLHDTIGHDNFIIKPHPRGVYDDFQGELSVYKDSCPFELALSTGQFENKTLISFYSTACVSGKLLFNSNCRIIFLYPLAEDTFNEKCDYEDYFKAFSSTCSNVFIARTWEELEALCK